MRALVLKAYGSVEELEARDIAEPRLSPGEVLVQVSAASINPIDWKLRSGALRMMVPLAFPAVLGRDVAGVVIGKGAGVTKLQTGDHVLGLVDHGYAERVVASEDAFARLPEGFDLNDAAALPLVLLTGAQLIDEAVRPLRGQSVLVTGALGSVGRVAVFVARRLGAHVFAGVRANQMEQAAGLGCEGVVSLDDGGDLSQLKELDAIADTVGHASLSRLFPHLKKGGTIGSVVGQPPEAAGKGFTVRELWAHPDTARLSELVLAVARGELIIPIAKRVPLAQGAQAQREAEQGGLGGKVLLLM